MKLLRFQLDGAIDAGVLTETGVVSFAAMNARHGTALPPDLLAFIQQNLRPQIETAGVATIPVDRITPLLPYDVPPKIWCIGLNYRSHAEDIQAVQPEEPGSFMKPASCLLPIGGSIRLPRPEISTEVDAEGELGLILGKTCKDVPLADVSSVLFGYTTTLDLTALDVLRRNPRYLTRAKALDTFFSFGPVIVTADEIPDVNALEVITEHNGAVYSRDFVRNMRHRPFELVRFHSEYFTWEPGDVLSTGCPKGARIQAGDHVGARIEAVGHLTARVQGAGELRSYS